MSQTRRTKPYLVDAESVPSCLRHNTKAGILEDAQNLAVFLEEAVSNTFAADSEPSVGFRIGLSLTFSLLQDKLRIACGELPFPLSTLFPDEADGVLWIESKEDGHADA